VEASILQILQDRRMTVQTSRYHDNTHLPPIRLMMSCNFLAFSRRSPVIMRARSSAHTHGHEFRVQSSEGCASGLLQMLHGHGSWITSLPVEQHAVKLI